MAKPGIQPLGNFGAGIYGPHNCRPARTQFESMLRHEKLFMPKSARYQ